jgi:uncharacterized membrane protein
MRRINAFLVLLLASLIALVALIIVGFYVFAASPYPTDWMTGMGGHMGSMMDGVTVQNPASPYLSIAFIVIIGVTIISAGGLVYFLMFPEITTADHAKNAGQVSGQNSTAYDAIVKTLTEEERKVIQVLKTHNGKYLQKYIRKEAGLSRLKTHRILARLADRDIVALKKSGNTNEVHLSEWISK